MEVDILEFKVPVENHKTLFVWDIQPELTEAQVYFYSAVQASEAQRRTDGRPLIQDLPLKVRLSSKHTHFLPDNSRPLSHAHCLELANHYLGFNGWTSDIITLKELPEEEEEEEGGGRWRSLKFGCVLQLSFPHHGLTTRGAAMVEEGFTCTGPDVLLQNRKKLLKRARENALVQAFSSVLLIVLGDGRVMVELQQTSDQFLAEPSGLLQVTEVSWREAAAEEEDLPVS
ncbi:RAD52 motif-containing protein 1 isoform X2 [Pseudoliparis swirei]|uniref:RAD52 motif-containing protein 1 isoform X2 n=1 Tax=Pseudoliparis swirei TaxID=2059687 RepID=UPI0024BEEB59|nr:RAD52 motif-containing protein 1 isoform X2 [Pseudoliparis swirei]